MATAKSQYQTLEIVPRFYVILDSEDVQRIKESQWKLTFIEGQRVPVTTAGTPLANVLLNVDASTTVHRLNSNVVDYRKSSLKRS